MDPKVSVLHSLPLFTLMDTKNLSALASRSQIIQIPKGGIIYKANTFFEHLIYVGSGEVRSIELGNERRVSSVANIPKGQLIGLMHLFAKRPRLDTLQALSGSRIWLLNVTDVEKALLDSPAAMTKYCQILIETMHTMHKEKLLLLMERADSRILGILAKYIKIHNQALFLEDLPTQQMLADLSNTSRETVSRTINKWFIDGVLAKENGKILVKSPQLFKYFM